MCSRDDKRLNRSGRSSIVLALGAALLYIISYGPVVAYCLHSEAGQNTLNVVLTIYRPLALVVPEPFMREYTELCGCSDIEAFVFVGLMRSGGHLPDDLGIDCS